MVALVYHWADLELLFAQCVTSFSMFVLFVCLSVFLIVSIDRGIVISTLSMCLVVPANSSALSFPGIPMWLGIQLRVTFLPTVLCCRRSVLMLYIRCVFSFCLVLCSVNKADLESVCIVTLVCPWFMEYCSVL